MRIVSVILLCSSLALGFAAPASAVMLGQVDDFQTDVQGWARGATSTPGPAGAGDAFLEIDSGDTQGGRLVTFNSTQWAGDYQTAGVTAIQLSAINRGNEILQLRLAIGNDTAPQVGGTWFASSNSIVLEVGSGWVPVELSLDPADLTRVQGTASAATVLGDVVTLRLLHSAAPDSRGDVGGVLGVDDITAVPEASLPWSGGAALATLAALARAATGRRTQTSSSASRSSIV